MTKYAFQCPKCRSTRIGVVATTFLDILQTPDGWWETEATSDHMYDADSSAECLTCEYYAQLSAFHTQD